VNDSITLKFCAIAHHLGGIGLSTYRDLKPWVLSPWSIATVPGYESWWRIGPR
jgi:hypothetical protein